MQNELYYTHSGRFTLMGPLLGLVAGILAAVIAGVVYAYCVLYIPFIYANALLCLACGLAIGAVAGRAMAWLKVRNPAIMYSVALLAALVGYYVAWAVWVNGIFHRGASDIDLTAVTLIKNPRVLWRLIEIINEHGAWTLGHSSKTPVTGPFLWIAWIGEAALLLTFVVLGVRSVLSTPFCEQCESWCEEDKAVCRLAAGDPATLRTALEAKNFGVMDAIGQKKASAASWFQLDLHACRQCGQTSTLTAKLVTQLVDKKGKVTTKTKDIVNKLLLDPTQRTQFLEACGRVQQGLAPA